MATHKTSSISNVRHPFADAMKGIGDVYTYNGIYEAIVISSKDIQKNGRLKVRLVSPSANVDFVDENDAQKYLDITVQWSSPFAGATNLKDTVASGDPTAPGEEDPDKTFSGTQRSYGMWMVPPDAGNRVLVMFLNGDIARGIVIGCMYQPLMNHMVPGIARSKTFTANEGETLEVPVAEYNKASNEAKNVDWKTVRENDGGTPTDNVRRPSHTPHFNGLKEQGLEQDKTRGLTSSSARRESPSQVFGVLTPGGHQFVMDDADQKLVRLRTTSGAQILLDESNGNVYIINKKGTGWVEIDDAGKIDVWANDSISIRSHKDINLRADRDLNIESGRNINVKTHQTTSTDQPSDTTQTLTAVNGAFNLDVAGALNIKTVDATTLTSGKEFHLQSTATFLTTTQGNTEIKSAGNHNETASQIHMNGPAAVPATPYSGLSVKVDDEGNLYFTNTLYTRNSDGNRETEKIGTILTRFPAREPFVRETFE
jgi:hypothetical protein